MELKKPKLRPFSIRSLSPRGWLRRQLEIQAEGLSGHLDEFWPDVRDSQWIGGSCEGWERVPYWLDGFIPLACLLGDEDKIARARRYVDAILSRQQADGWLCPCPEEARASYDVWALFLILKVLTVYEDATGDARVEPAVYRALRCLDLHIDRNPLFGWAQMRWFESLISIFWLYERRPEGWLLDLAVKLRSQGFDYGRLLERFPYREPGERGRWSQMNHGVNLAMAVKSGALESRLDGRESTLRESRRLLETLDCFHGTAAGVFTADECLAGKSPVQGTELCAVAELMYSLEHLLAVTGEETWARRLEQAAFNALPAALSPDMWTHQYDQQVNQLGCVETENPTFLTNGGDAGLFGLEPHFGCCTANFNQAWPKFACSTLFQSDSGVFVASCVPAQAGGDWQGVPFTVTVAGDYPFRESASITVATEKPARFALELAVPGWAVNPTLEAAGTRYVLEPGSVFRLEQVWEGRRELALRLPMRVEVRCRLNGMAVLQRGPLTYSLKLNETWKRVHEDVPGREFPHCDYEVRPEGEWAFGFHGLHGIQVRELDWEKTSTPFSPENPPVELLVDCVPVEWELIGECCPAPCPASREPVGEPRTLPFLPYGCTNLRMTELPVCGG